MSRKVRVFLLSVLAVIFAVSSAFAEVNTDIDIEIDDTFYDEDTELLTTLTTEGYTYTNKLVLTGDGLEIETNGQTKTYTLSDMNIDWVVSGEKTEWLHFYTASKDQVLIMEGKIPAYSYAQEYNIQVIATASINLRQKVQENSADITVKITVYSNDILPDNVIKIGRAHV